MPHKERFASKTEIVTELTILGLLYTLQGFKGDLLQPDVQYTVGWIAVLVLGQYICIHLVYNVYGTIKDCIGICKTKCCPPPTPEITKPVEKFDTIYSPEVGCYLQVKKKKKTKKIRQKAQA
jgi:hypothetical protein